jgi:nitroreductase
LENANWAPTHGKTEPWRFTIFAGDAKTDLGEKLANFYKENTTAEKFNQTKYLKYAERSAKASHIIAICVKRKPKVRIPLIEDIEAVACAVQNLHLSATAYGIAGYWHSGSMTYKQAAKDYLNLGEEDRCLGFFYLGYTAKPWPIGKKQPIADKIEWR